MSQEHLTQVINGSINKAPDLHNAIHTTTVGHMIQGHMIHDDVLRTTTEDSIDHLWSFSAHEIISITIVGVSVVTALLIAFLYYMYKFCRCCHKCRKNRQVSDKTVDENNIEGIFVTRADWDKPKKPEMKTVASNSSIKSFI